MIYSSSSTSFSFLSPNCNWKLKAINLPLASLGLCPDGGHPCRFGMQGNPGDLNITKFGTSASSFFFCCRFGSSRFISSFVFLGNHLFYLCPHARWTICTYGTNLSFFSSQGMEDWRFSWQQTMNEDSQLYKRPVLDILFHINEAWPFLISYLVFYYRGQ